MIRNQAVRREETKLPLYGVTEGNANIICLSFLIILSVYPQFEDLVLAGLMYI